ncbi:hypothetical protein MMC19_003954 [Ptychographa xylographoides]|nr:hypothetical protein [Ptychographa xylographoides]
MISHATVADKSKYRVLRTFGADGRFRNKAETLQVDYQGVESLSNSAGGLKSKEGDRESVGGSGEKDCHTHRTSVYIDMRALLRHLQYEDEDLEVALGTAIVAASDEYTVHV